MPPEVEARRFENLHTEEGAHFLIHYTDVETSARGCITTRTVTASTLLTDYIDWPGLAQVYRYQTHREKTKTGEISHRIRSIALQVSHPKPPPLKICSNSERGHWTIENKVHWVRDTALREDASQARTGKYSTRYGSITQHCHVGLTF